MSFKILYVEDNPRDRVSMADAIAEANRREGAMDMECILVEHYNKMPLALIPDIQLVIADLWFGEGAGEWGLDEIIMAVRASAEDQGLERPIPLIAYTGRAKASFERCLSRRNDLFDIWDKETASPAYVVWRLSGIASDLSRYKPDAVLQRCVRQLPTGARWHIEVQEMTRRYDGGWSERDQIVAAGRSVKDIAHGYMDAGVWSVISPLWTTIEGWERFSRAGNSGVRGHARHVINVFWLGYWILNEPSLKAVFENAWQSILHRRGKMQHVAANPPSDSLNDAWFIAALFHDASQCIEHKHKLEGLLTSLARRVGYPSGEKKAEKAGREEVSSQSEWLSSVLERGEAAINALELSVAATSEMQSAWKASVVKEGPDHGILTSLFIRSQEVREPYATLIKEGGRAMELHNLISVLSSDPGIDWQAEPLMCLLILCDQLQSWDREVHDEGKTGNDWPERSELLKLYASVDGGRVKIHMVINYISPRHLEHAHLVRERMQDSLIEVLRDKPSRAIHRISKPWPFSLGVQFCLDRKPLLRRAEMVSI